MRKCPGFFTGMMLFSLMLLGLMALPAQAAPLKIVAGTSLIEDIVLDLTDRKAEVMTLIPGASCPGHETAKTADFVFAAKADLVLVHVFQQNMLQLSGMMTAVNNPRLRLVVLDPGGNWLVPAVQKQAIRDIAAVLAETAPDQAAAIEQRATARMKKVDALAADSLARLAAVNGKSVAVADMQSEFVGWAGLHVRMQYKRAEEMNTQRLARLVDDLRKENLAGVVDNYQSGTETGLPLAMELKVPHIVISNFPGSNDQVQNYFSLLRYNVDQLLRLDL